MITSPVLEPIKTPSHRVVSGEHRTCKTSAYLNVRRLEDLSGLDVWFGHESPTSQYLKAQDFRELAELFAAIANALEPSP